MRIGKATIALGLAAAVLATPSAFADKKSAPVTLAEVASQAKATRLTNVTALLRDDIETELAAIDWSKAGVRKRYLLSAAVVRLESTARDGALAASCTVSATVRDDRGTILAIVEGRARAEEAPSAAAVAERGALAAAARGAVTAVPEAIRRTQ